ncbi:MAG: KH domain-containing protein [Clostridia bacterium]|nr:KH domain-containing protein [Clostridia bacterium]
MLDLKEVLYGIARAIVDNPEEVTVSEVEDDDTVTLTLSVAEGDMGLVIGRHGRIAKAIRTVMKAAAGTVSKKVNVEIR